MATRLRLSFLACLLMACSFSVCAQQDPDQPKFERRVHGWSIDASVGPNIPLGRFKGRSSGKSHYAAIGVGAALHNNVIFTCSMMGRPLGLHTMSDSVH